MADFCKKCWPEVWHAGANMEDLEDGTNDFKGLCKPGEMFADICEGCGPGHFDHNGARVRTHHITEEELAEIDKMIDAQLEDHQLAIEEMPEDLFE